MSTVVSPSPPKGYSREQFSIRGAQGRSRRDQGDGEALVARTQRGARSGQGALPVFRYARAPSRKPRARARLSRPRVHELLDGEAHPHVLREREHEGARGERSLQRAEDLATP